MIRFALRFLFLLLPLLGILAFLAVNLSEKLTLSWFRKDLDMRSRFTASLIIPSFLHELRAQDYPEISELFERFTRDERLLALAFCDTYEKLLVHSIYFPPEMTCLAENTIPTPHIRELASGAVHIANFSVEDEGKKLGELVVVQDLSFVKRRSEQTRYYIFLSFLVLTLFVSAISLLVGFLTYRRWLTGLRTVFAQPGSLFGPKKGIPSELLPVLSQLRSLLREIDTARRAEAGLRLSWSPQTLKSILSSSLLGQEVIVVSNREPYIHSRRNGSVKVERPASGVVTALEPVLQSCAGTWIAHGSGDADRDFVDKDDSLRVPPEKNLYKLRRVWLSDEEITGYYQGFSNEGLWPLCLTAHVRPIFRSADWKIYAEVNEKFAEIVVQESTREDPVILVQDYHFALLPLLLRERLPKATIITFWHIPWPNPESFGICPWRNELLRGLLGSTILGFQTRFHVNNFLATVDRFLESQIDRDHLAIRVGGKTTLVRGYPISIPWASEALSMVPSASTAKALIQSRHNLPGERKIILGVDRLDYTKGIQERFLAFELLLSSYPEWQEKSIFIQIAAPTREALGGYKRYAEDTCKLVERINGQFSSSTPPIIFLYQNFSPSEVYTYLKAADVCVITSLHDGMNLVAKEFVAAHDDELGVLILSLFTGASQELPEALIVNPYNLDQVRDALAAALLMPEKEQQRRMQSMRMQVRDFNIFRWAGRILLDAAEARQREVVSEFTAESFERAR